MPMPTLAPVLSPPLWLGPVLMVVAVDFAELVELVESLLVGLSAPLVLVLTLVLPLTLVLVLMLVLVLVTLELVDEHTSPALTEEQKESMADCT